MSGSRSGAMPRSTPSKPASASRPSSVHRLVSRIWPRRSGPPSSDSSSPVDSTPTRGRGWATTSYAPMPASTPRRAADTAVPASSTSSPSVTSSPGRRTWLPALTAASTTTRSAGPSAGRVSSTFTTASAPGGMGAPVMIRAAWPGPTLRSPASPAATVPTTSSSTGAPAVSVATTAKPSMAVLANAGTASADVTGSARIRPSASPSGTRRGAGTATRSSTWARASASGIIAANPRLVATWSRPGLRQSRPIGSSCGAAAHRLVLRGRGPSARPAGLRPTAPVRCRATTARYCDGDETP